jgi:hypothetical protein
MPTKQATSQDLHADPELKKGDHLKFSEGKRPISILYMLQSPDGRGGEDTSSTEVATQS